MGGERYREVPLSEIAEFRNGKGLSPENYTPSGKYPVFGSNGQIARTDSLLIEDSVVVIGRVGAYCGSVHPVFQPSWVTDNAIVARPRPGVDVRYLYYRLVSLDLSSTATGSAQPLVTQGGLSVLRAPHAPSREQRAIANILGTLDDKIELNRQTNETLEAMARTLFKSWFVDFNPVRAKAEGRQPSGMDAETVKLFPSEFEESELGEIPKGWRVGTIADCGLVITGKTPSKADPSLFSSTYPFIKIPDMHGCLWITSTQDGLSEAGHLVQSSKLVPPKSVAVSCIATVGLVSLIRRASHTNQQINTVVPSSTTSWAWLFFALRELVPEIEARSLGGSVTKNLNKGQFEAIPVLLPPAPVQRVFEQVVGDLLGLVAARDDESGRLRSVRDQLLPQLLSGELSVASAQQMEGAK